jgi:hypothetical protein
MQTWWPMIGEISLMAGVTAGFAWATLSTLRRRLAFINAAQRPIGQLRWFMATFVSMSAYLSLVAALGLSAAHNIIPQQLFWFLLGLSAFAFGMAMLLPGTPVMPRTAVGAIDLREPTIDPPVPARQLA